MLVDLHAHYPMHLLPSERQLAHEQLRRWRKEWFRARVVRALSRHFNYQGSGGTPGVTLEEMRDGDVGVILSVLYSPFDEIDLSRRYGARARPAYFGRLLDQLTMVEEDIEEHRKSGTGVVIAHSPADLDRAIDAGEQVLIHAVEGGFHLGDTESEIRENVRALAAKGVAYVTVAHLFWRHVATNAPALPFMPDRIYNLLFPQPKQVGLSELGRAAVNAMVDHGVLVDITHMSERAITETLDLLDERDPQQTVPVIATHMACRFGSLEYNLPDSVIKRVAKRGGLLGLIACKHYISDGESQPESFEESFELICKHIDRICRVSGSDRSVAFGSDLDGYIKPALPGLETLGHMQRLQERLADRYGSERAARFASGNALEVLRKAWRTPHAEAEPGRAAPGRAAKRISPAPVESDGEAGPSRSAHGAACVAFEIVGFLLGLLGYLYLVGWVVDRVRLSSAGLPAYLAAEAFGTRRLIGDGLRTTALTGTVFALLCLVAYFASALHWEENGPFWHDLLRRRGGGRDGRPTMPLGEAAMRVLAGFNTVVLAALIALVPARGVDALFPDNWWAVLAAWVVAFLAGYLVLSHWAPVIWGRRIGAGLWVLVVLAAAFASAPFGLLVLASVLFATFGRTIMRIERPNSIGGLVRSPLPWALLVVVTLMGVAYQAMPPVSYPSATILTAAGERTGAYVARTGDGVYLGSCTTREDATSTDARLSLVPAGEIKAATVESRPYRFDSGERPSLLTLALHAVGVDGSAPTWFDADLRARAETCGGSGTMPVSNDPALGEGVLVGPAPPDGRARDGEAPIEATSPAAIAELARRYQPTLEVTVADRFWPVSVGAVMAERGPDGARACLVQTRAPRVDCEALPSSLLGSEATSRDYLQLPVELSHDSSAQGQFEAFARGQEAEPGLPSRWLSDPTSLEPWNTAQVYFYLADKIDAEQWPAKARSPLVQSGLVGLEYWFYYPYNYYPAVVRAKLMQQTPLAGAVYNVDRHQGDWEHVDVLLDPETLKPLWLYMARHAYEGQFVRWSKATLMLDESTHPVVQAAFGGHPTYEPGCGAQPRAVSANVLGDWLVCGTGRFAFKAESTPLVDMGRVPWACWPGHFGEATKEETTESLLNELRRVVLVAGPNSPLQQAENTGTCKGDPLKGESQVLARLQAGG